MGTRMQGCSSFRSFLKCLKFVKYRDCFVVSSLSAPLYSTSKEIGTYYCAVCGNPLFQSDTKFDSGCGWPSFYQPISKTSIVYHKDKSLGMERTEVTCGRCKSHLGHVFDDGPPPTGLRYCINGVVLDFEKAKTAEKSYTKKQKKATSGK